MVSRDGSKIFTTAVVPRGEMLRYDAAAHQFLPFLGGVSAYIARFSRDGKWIAYTSYPDDTLWRARADGTDRLQLTYSPLVADMLAISPDGSQIALAAEKPGQGPGLYVVSMQGGAPRLLLEHGEYPVWSPDGGSLAFGQRSGSGGLEIKQLDLRDGKVTVAPDGQGKSPIAWPSSERLIARTTEATGVAFDVKNRKWSELAIGPFASLAPSPDGKYIYWEGREVPSHRVYRTRLLDGSVEFLMEIKGLHRVDGFDGTELGVEADGSALVTRDIGSEDIYALSVNWK